MSERFDTIVVDEGSTFDNTWYWTDVNGAPVPMAGAIASGMFRSDIEDTSPALTLTNVAGITLGASDGSIRVVLTAAQTTALRASLAGGRGSWNVRVTFADGVTKRYPIGGIIRVRRSPTR